jgi:hypothetical protein
MVCLNLIFQVQKGIGHVKGENLLCSFPLSCQQRTLSHTAPGSPTSLYFLTDEERMMKESGIS